MRVEVGSDSGAARIVSQDAEEEEEQGGGRYISDNGFSGPSVTVCSVYTYMA